MNTVLELEEEPREPAKPHRETCWGPLHPLCGLGVSSHLLSLSLSSRDPRGLEQTLGDLLVHTWTLLPAPLLYHPRDHLLGACSEH